MDVAAAQRPTVPQVILGLFISWQLFFLPATNYLAFFPHGQPEEGELSDSRRAPDPSDGAGVAQKAIELTAGITDTWTCLTGQVQAWWLFAPNVPSTATFPIVELRWDEDVGSAQSVASFLTPLAAVDGLQNVIFYSCSGPAQIPRPVRLHTIVEPDNPQSYFRTFSSFERLFHYELRLGLILSTWDEQTVADNPEFWREAVKDRVRRQWRSIRAYLRWYVQYFQQEHPDLPPPKQAILSIRIYPTPRPGQSFAPWTKPMEQPLARWWSHSPPRAGDLPIEAFDPVARHFVSLKVKD